MSKYKLLLDQSLPVHFLVPLDHFCLNCLFILLVFGCSNSTQPLIPLETKIIYMSELDDNPDIFSMNIDGSEQTNLTQSIGRELDFDICQDGSKIVFSRAVDSSPPDGGLNLFLMDIDGKNTTLIPTPGHYPRYPVFSPEGDKISYHAVFGSTDPGIYLVDLEGNKICNFTEGYRNWNFHYFSADGSEIIISLYDDSEEDFYLFITNSDGTNVRKVPNIGPKAGNVIFSSCGENIFYSSSEDGDDDIYKIKLDGSNKVKLTDFDEGNQYLIDATADRMQLLFGSSLWNLGIREYVDVFLMTDNGESISKVFSTPRGYNWVLNLDLSANGEMMVYQYIPDGEENGWSGLEIYRINSDGSGLVRLTDNSRYDGQPRFVPYH